MLRKTIPLGLDTCSRIKTGGTTTLLLTERWELAEERPHPRETAPLESPIGKRARPRRQLTRASSRTGIYTNVSHRTSGLITIRPIPIRIRSDPAAAAP